MIPRLLEKYRKEVVPEMVKLMGYKSTMQVPRLKKVVINMGVGEAIQDVKMLDKSVEELALIAGQKPVVTRSKKAIANFKIKEKQAIGCKVTLRRVKMYEFLDRLISIGLPRVRDFRGLNSKSFDGSGNYSLGIQEQIVFPEIDFDKMDSIRGMDICITTSAKTNEEAKALLEAFNLPLKDREKL